MGKLVTAVIPAFNYARFLPRAIESVLSQTYREIECIVVDDGSTDNTSEVLARYQTRVRAIAQNNRGLSAARNTGIHAAAGEFIAFLDADDLWLPAKIAEQLAAFQAQPNLGAIGCGAELVDAAGVHIRFLDYAQRHPVLHESWNQVSQFRAVALRQFWVSASGSGALIPKRTFEDVGVFDETLRAAEDWDMWLRIAAKYPIFNVDDVLVRIFQHGSSSFRNADKMERNQWSVYGAALRDWPNLLDGADAASNARTHICRCSR